MADREGNPLEWLRDIAQRVPAEHRARYSEIFSALANVSGLLCGEDDIRNYNEQVLRARKDLLAILREMATSPADDPVLSSLLRQYESRETVVSAPLED